MSISVPTLMIGFVNDAIRKIVSGSIGNAASRSRMPTHASWTT